ncbi:uncharacterized protein LOC102711260 [Oryza brachyantha]|uniref:Calmodulin-binding domain-containing protein n=1 Tax=Oryza brachyantha TaxID=4533 RepID=J3M6N2_ORYBR|nr:uncharacterized protein LOC102711260 [Oryza brachyantha]
MVRSKVVHKKPKDPLVTPPSAKLRRFQDDDGGGGGSRPRNRGGVAMSPAVASVPNYMRGTSSSDAKVGRGASRPLCSASPPRRRPVRVVTRGKVLFQKAAAAGPGLGRATCSSTMKDAKFPDALDLAPGATDAEGPAAMRVCPYTYCSLNGHAHSPAVPLRSFLASRRRLIKTQQSMKLKGVSAFRKGTGHPRPEDRGGAVACAAAGARVAPPIDEEALGDFFVEVYAGPRVSTDMSCSDMSLDEMDATVRRMEFVVFDRCGADDSNGKGNGLDVRGDGDDDARLEERYGAFRDNSSECSDASTSGEFVEELPWMRYQGYEDDSLDGELLDEHRIRDEEITGAVVSEEQDGQHEEGTPGRSDDECEDEAVQEQEANDEENISDFVGESEIVKPQEGVDFRVEACAEQEGISEDNILDVAHQTEVGTEQEIQEQKNFAAICNLEIPEQEVAESVSNILDETEGTSTEQEEEGDGTNMESASISEVTKELNVEDEENAQDDGGSEMEISEEIISGFGCEEDLSEEVTSKHVSEGEISDFGAIIPVHVEMHKKPVDNHAFEQDDCSTADNAFHQDDNIANKAFDEDDITADGHCDSQKELGITMGELIVASEEGGIQEAKYHDPVDCTEDVHKELDVFLCDSQGASEGSGIAQESNQDANSSFNDGVEMVPDITTQTLEDGSKESDAAEETTHDYYSAPLTACAEMELGNGTNDLMDDSSYVNEEPDIAQETGEDNNAEYVSDDDCQKATAITRCQLQVASEVIAQEADDNDRDGVQNESEQIPCESAGSEECDVTTIQNDNTADFNDGALQECVDTSESKDAHEESDVTQDSDKEDCSVHTNAVAQKEIHLDACESGGASEGTTVPPENDGHVNTTDLNNSAPKEITGSISDACEDHCITEETSYSSNMVLPDLSDNFSAEGHEKLHNQETATKESCVDDICDAFSGMHLKGDVYLDPTESMTCPRNRLIIARRRKTPEEEEYLRGFNPRAPNFLPLELDPDSEKVDLKHQMMDERKNAEEWMIDYALRRAVNNLGPARKKKVELLVQAFETVLPHDEEEKKSITPTRPVQACN